MSSSRFIPIISATAIVSLVLVGAGLAGGGSSASAVGSVLLQDGFTSSTVSSQEYVIGGTGPTTAGDTTNTACLSAIGSPADQVPASCTDTSDPDGSGALRITQKSGNQTGFLLNNHPLPTKAGLRISFDMYQYGGSGADGLSFFLSDGAYALTTVGAAGGSLGYSNSTKGSGIGKPGVPHGLLGVAFDAYGNFTYETNNASCATDPTWIGSVRSAQTVAVRGPGAQLGDATWNDGYCLLGAPQKPTDGLAIDNTATQTRAASLRHVTIVIDPPTDASPQVSVYLGDLGDASSAAPTLVTQVPEPSILKTTPTFKFGWAASTGGSTDVHEVSALQVATVNVLPPQLTASATSPATVDAGATADVTFASASKGPEGQVESGAPITQTVTTDGGVAFGTLPPTFNGWALASKDATHAVYSYTPTALILPGTALPSLTLPITGSTAGSHPVTAVISGGGIVEADNPESERTAIATVAVRPTVSATAGTAGPASATPTAAKLTVPTPGGAGTPTYSLVTSPSTADGTASISAATGVVSFTPKAGVSGVSMFTYRATTGGIDSAPATITVSTPPSVSGDATTIASGATATFDLSAGALGSTLSYSSVSAPPASDGTISLAGDTLTFTPAPGFTGTTTTTFRATDAAGLPSAPATLSVTVSPQAGSDSLVVPLVADGSGTGASTLPVVSGSSGPFNYSLASAPSSGTLAISADGHYSYTAVTNVSGVFTGTYIVTDAHGNASAPAAITITVRPFVPAITSTTDADATVTAAAPSTSGAGGGIFSVVQPAGGGIASIDTTTGAITFAPSPGISGVVAFSYGVSANGVSSNSGVVTIDVLPTVTAKTTSTAYATATTVDLADGASGSSLSYSIVTGAGAAGTATVDPTSGLLTFAPAAGYSGTAVITFRATDPSALQSATRTVSIDVQPVAGTSAPVLVLPQNGTTPQQFSLPVAGGTGPFSYAIVPGSVTPGAGTVVVDPATGVVTYTPVAGRSGVVAAEYTVTDAAGTSSQPQAITLTVLPFAGAVTSTADAGQAAYVLPAPATSGTGPLTYSLVSQPGPAVGTSSIDPTTGIVTFVPADPAASGIVDFSYAVTDAGGTTSRATSERLTIRPAADPASARMTGALVAPGAVALTPVAHGTGPFTFALLTQPSNGTVTVTPSGFSFTPDAAFSGVTTFRFSAVDSSSVDSDAQTATITVDGIAVVGSGDPAPAVLAFTGATNVVATSLCALGAVLAGAVLSIVAIHSRRRSGGRHVAV